MNDYMHTNQNSNESDKNSNTQDMIGQYVSWRVINRIYTDMIKCLVPKRTWPKRLPTRESLKEKTFPYKPYIYHLNGRFMVQVKMTW